MKVQIRPESVENERLMTMLKHEVSEMILKLDRHKFPMYENMVHIWIKEYNGNFYPKIEFDINRQEIQYDMTVDGEINETHFKSFEKRGNKTIRVDLAKKDACVELQRLDTIIRFTER